MTRDRIHILTSLGLLILVLLLLSFVFFLSSESVTVTYPTTEDITRYPDNFLQIIDSNKSIARELSNEGHHVEAALVLMDIAGALRIFDREASSSTIPNTPSALENWALLEFSQAGNEYRDMYLKILQTRYQDYGESNDVAPPQ